MSDPLGYGRIEYAYHLMARAAGITMSDCRLMEENDRAHFMTRRIDRDATGGKFHIQSLCGMAHFDFNQASTYSYEQAFQVARRLGLPQPAPPISNRRGRKPSSTRSTPPCPIGKPMPNTPAFSLTGSIKSKVSFDSISRNPNLWKSICNLARFLLFLHG